MAGSNTRSLSLRISLWWIISRLKCEWTSFVNVAGTAAYCVCGIEHASPSLGLGHLINHRTSPAVESARVTGSRPMPLLAQLSSFLHLMDQREAS